MTVIAEMLPLLEQAHNPNLWEKFLEHVRRQLAKNYDQKEISVMKGKKYWRLVLMGPGDSQAAYGFYNPNTGELLKSAGWKGPAKGVRGYLHDPATWKCAGRFSIT